MVAKEDLPRPPAAHIDSRRVALVGLVLFAIASVVCAIGFSWLRDHGHEIWLWTSLAGFGLGLCGYALAGRHRGMGRTD